MDKLEPYIKKVDNFIAQYPSLTFYGTLLSSATVLRAEILLRTSNELFATSRRAVQCSSAENDAVKKMMNDPHRSTTMVNGLLGTALSLSTAHPLFVATMALIYGHGCYVEG